MPQEMVEAFSQLWFVATGTLLLGLIVGSFLNVVIYRLPIMMQAGWKRDCCALLEQPEPELPRLSLAHPNSRCPKCDSAIKPWHNIPVVSYLMLGGKCANCKTGISIRYPIVELITGLLSLAAGMQFGFSYELLAALVMIWSLIALTGIDFDTQLLPDSITLPLLWLGLALNLSGMFTDLNSAVIGAIAGYGILWSVYWAFKLLTGKEGMGFGDFKLLGALGAWFGWQSLPAIILLSSGVGAVVGIALVVLAKQGKEIPIAFGPYLAGAGMLYLFFGEWINREYLSLTGLS